MASGFHKHNICIAPKPRSLTERAAAKAEAAMRQEQRNKEFFDSGRDAQFSQPFTSGNKKPIVWHKGE